MSRKGTCLDNSIMENFFSLLKQKIYHGREYHSFEELKQAIEDYIHYYNHERMKGKLNWQSPVQFREGGIKKLPRIKVIIKATKNGVGFSTQKKSNFLGSLQSLIAFLPDK